MYRLARSNPSSGTFMRRHLAAPAAGLAVACLAVAGLAGCGSKPAASVSPPPAPSPPPLATSYAAASGAGWAVVEMGGSAAQENNFWELFARQSATAAWRLATPVGVADNGGLVVAGNAGSLLTGFRPSQDLTFSPLAASSDNGASWSPEGPVSPGLANVPDALAVGPGGRDIALTSGGVELASGTGWTRLTSARALAATPAGRACGLTGLTAAAFSSSGAAMLAGSCDRPGMAGIFTDSGRAWRAAGPGLPSSLARDDIEVLRLAKDVALLRAGTSLVAAWSDGTRWALSAPLRAGSVTSTALGPGGSLGIILNATRAATLAGPGSAWHVLPALPAWAATLALGPGGQVDAIAAHASTFADWRLGASGWSRAQTMNVTIPYGSSS
jgi:hypothetical protein